MNKKNEASKSIGLGLIGIGLALTLLFAYWQSVSFFKVATSDPNYLNSIASGKSDDFYQKFRIVMSIIYMALGIPSIALGILGVLKKESVMLGKILSIVSIVLGGVLILVVGLTSFH